MGQIALMQPHVPINPCTGVPAGAVFVGNGQHLDFVLRPITQERIQVSKELGIAVAVFCHQFSVEIDRRLGHDPFKFHGNLLAFPRSRRKKSLGVGVGLHGIVSGLIAAGRVGTALLLNHGILREHHRYGLCVRAENCPEGVGYAGSDFPAGVPNLLVHLVSSSTMISLFSRISLPEAPI